MDIKEIYLQVLRNGGSLARAEFAVGNHYLKGKDVEQDLDEAEAWLLKAWDDGFPGTAATEAFILRRFWDRFLEFRYAESPRLRALLKEARIEVDERKGSVIIPVHNDAQARWLEGPLEDMSASLLHFTGGRFCKISVQVEKAA